MRAIVLYDSYFGSTEKIARIVAKELAHDYTVELARPAELKSGSSLPDVLVVGSPTRQRQPTPAIRQALRSLGRGGLEGVAAAAFDTRYHRPRFLTGSAAIRIAQLLKRFGALVEIGAESFFVEDQKGPLESGEVDRAERWARQVRFLVRPNPQS